MKKDRYKAAREVIEIVQQSPRHCDLDTVIAMANYGALLLREIEIAEKTIEDFAMMLRRCAVRLRNHGQMDLAAVTLELLRKHQMAGGPLRSEEDSSNEAP